MIDFIVWLVLVIGVITIFLPQKWFKHLNTPMLGLLLCSVAMAYIIGAGAAVTLKAVIDLIKGWIC